MLNEFSEVFPYTMTTQERKRGRPRSVLNPSKRKQHIALALLYLGTNWTLARVAKSYDVSLDTARRWIRLALTYHEPEADCARTLAKNYRRKIKFPENH